MLGWLLPQAAKVIDKNSNRNQRKKRFRARLTVYSKHIETRAIGTVAAQAKTRKTPYYGGGP
ncbi:MAG: hypothetical protein ABSG35_01365 [Syntrophobacteraceae bacterium]